MRYSSVAAAAALTLLAISTSLHGQRPDDQVDPRNRAAFVSLGQVAEERGLPGKAIRLYREALLLEPNDVSALKGQGEALVAKGAVARAKDNLAKIRTLCGKAGCADATVLAATIAKGPPIATAAVEIPTTKPAAKE